MPVLSKLISQALRDPAIVALTMILSALVVLAVDRWPGPTVVSVCVLVLLFGAVLGAKKSN